MNNREIDLQNGVGDLHFSMNQQQFISILGQPTQIDNDDLNGCIAYYYNEMELGVIFVETGDKLVIDSFELDDKSYTLNGISIYDKSFEEIVKLLNQNGMNELDINDECGYRTIMYQNLFIGFNDKNEVDNLAISNPNL